MMKLPRFIGMLLEVGSCFLKVTFGMLAALDDKVTTIQWVKSGFILTGIIIIQKGFSERERERGVLVAKHLYKFLTCRLI